MSIGLAGAGRLTINNLPHAGTGKRLMLWGRMGISCAAVANRRNPNAPVFEQYWRKPRFVVHFLTFVVQRDDAEVKVTGELKFAAS